MPTPDARPILEFAQRLLAVLDQGRKTATYKYAVLLALIDLCAESTADGAPPTSITTPRLARRVAELYWPHARLFPGETSRILHQNTGHRQAEIVRLLSRYRESHPEATSPSRAAIRDPAAFDKLLTEVEWKLVEMPLPKLQRLLGTADEPFLYRIHWTDDITRRDFQSPGFDNRILLLPDVGEWLAQLGGLLRPIIERRWATFVSEANADLLPDAELDAFLFGIDRQSLETLQRPLLQLQQHRCFYCSSRLDHAAHVDHFIPWARHPSDAIDNLVVAHSACNLAKSDHLVATGHLRRWREHRDAGLEALERMARDLAWQAPGERTLGIVRGLYLRLPEGAKLWVKQREFEAGGLEEIRRVLAA